PGGRVGPPAPRTPHRADLAIAGLVLSPGRELAAASDPGARGAGATHRALRGRGLRGLPATRTSGRVRERRGAWDGPDRRRRPPPPRGWSLPRAAGRLVESDSGDIVGGLVRKDGPQVEGLDGASRPGGRVGSRPRAAPVTATAP